MYDKISDDPDAVGPQRRYWKYIILGSIPDLLNQILQLITSQVTQMHIKFQEFCSRLHLRPGNQKGGKPEIIVGTVAIS